MGARARTLEDKQQRRRLILEAAKELFFDRGYRDTTIEMITERAGLSTGTFYLYFKSKQEIYMTLYADGIDIFHRMAEEAISWPGMKTLARLSAIAHAYYRFYTEHTEYFDILAFIHMHQAELKEPSEMASMLDLSENTVKNHRSQIRNKLGIKHKKINLRSYLRSLSK